MFRVERAGFGEVLPIWRDFLWPGRRSPIEAVSAISPSGATDLDLSALKPVFFAVRGTDGIVGVNSGFQTSATRFRSRGIWVRPGLRGCGVGRLLMEAVAREASATSCTHLWSMPRVESWPFYSKCGFGILHRTDRYEFGPHYLAERTVTS